MEKVSFSGSKTRLHFVSEKTGSYSGVARKFFAPASSENKKDILNTILR